MEERDEASVERDRRKVQGGRWATTVLLARGEARRVGRDGDSNDGVVEERSGDGAQLPQRQLDRGSSQGRDRWPGKSASAATAVLASKCSS